MTWVHYHSSSSLHRRRRPLNHRRNRRRNHRRNRASSGPFQRRRGRVKTTAAARDTACSRLLNGPAKDWTAASQLRFGMLGLMATPCHHQVRPHNLCRPQQRWRNHLCRHRIYHAREHVQRQALNTWAWSLVLRLKLHPLLAIVIFLILRLLLLLKVRT